MIIDAKHASGKELRTTWKYIWGWYFPIILYLNGPHLRSHASDQTPHQRHRIFRHKKQVQIIQRRCWQGQIRLNHRHRTIVFRLWAFQQGTGAWQFLYIYKRSTDIVQTYKDVEDQYGRVRFAGDEDPQKNKRRYSKKRKGQYKMFMVSHCASRQLHFRRILGNSRSYNWAESYKFWGD